MNTPQDLTKLDGPQLVEAWLRAREADDHAEHTRIYEFVGEHRMDVLLEIRRNLHACSTE